MHTHIRAGARKISNCVTKNVKTANENTTTSKCLKPRQVEQVGTICRISNIKTDRRREVGKQGLNPEFSTAGRQEIFYRA